MNKEELDRLLNSIEEVISENLQFSKDGRELIHQLLIESQPEVDEEWIQNKVNRMEQLFLQRTKREDREFFIRHEVLKKAKVKIIKK